MPIASVFRPALLVVALASAAVFSTAASGQTTSTVMDGFNPNVNGNVYAVALQGDGKVLVAGKFETYQPSGAPQAIDRNLNIARVLPDGGDDTTFTAKVNGQIQVMLLEPDGQILIGGKFTEVNGVTRRRIARLNPNGTLDATFDPNIEPRDFNANPQASLTPEVMALALQADGKVLVGGGFKFVQPNGGAEVQRNRIARFNADGSLDQGFNPNVSAAVTSLAIQADGKILLGGGFKTFASHTTATKYQHLARVTIDGVLDESFAPKPNNSVNAIELMPSGRILIGGSFTSITPNGGDTSYTTTTTRIAQLNADGTVNTAFSGNADGAVSVLKLQPDGGILAGGSFASLGSGTRSYFGRLLPTGLLDTTFAPGANFAVYAVAVQLNGSIVLGGGFNTLAGQGRAAVVRNHVARVSFRGLLDNDFRPDVNGRLRSLVQLTDGKLLVGGSFTSIAGETRNGVVRLNANGSIDSSFHADVSGYVLTAVQLSSGKIIVGGYFSQINGERRVNLARLNADGSVDEDFDPAPNAQVNAMALQADGKLVIGGSFTALSPFKISAPVARGYIARINADGTLDLTYKPEANAVVYAIATQADGSLLFGGNFTAVIGKDDTYSTTRYAIARFSADGKLDTTFNPNVNGTITSIVVQPSDGMVIFGGSFAQLRPNPPTDGTTAEDPVTRYNLARVASTGTLDKTFDPSVNSAVYSIALQADKQIVIGGVFTALRPGNTGSGVMRNYVARLTTAGALDESFNLYLDTLPGNQIVGVAVTSDNKLVVAGAFTQIGANSVPRSRLARVNSDGSVDESFNSDVSSMHGASIEAMTLQFGGSVLVAGDFATLNGASGTNLARFYSDGAPDTAFVPSFDGPVHTMVEAPQKGATVATQYDGFAWLKADGQLKSGFTLDSGVTSMSSITTVAVQPDGKLLVAATFTLPDGNADGEAETPALIRFNPDGSLDSTFRHLTSGSIYAVKVLSDGKILIGGSFSAVDSATRANFARLNSDGSLDTSFTASCNSSVINITLQSDGKILLGGNFTTVTPNGATSGVTRNYLARLNSDGTLDTAFDPNPNNAVQVILVLSDNRIILGGGFTSFSKTVNSTTTTTARTYIARLKADGSVDETINLEANGYVSTAVVQADGKIVLGGSFTSIGGATRNYLARLNADELLTLDAAFNPNANQSVYALALQANGKILAAGAFTALQPNGSTYNPALATPRNRIARLNADGTIDGTFNPNFSAQVTSLVLYSLDETIIAAGSFVSVQPFGSVMVGGGFQTINGVGVSNLALFGSDGSVSSAFLPNPNGAVYTLMSYVDGSTVVGGDFTRIAGTTRNRLARFDANNVLDTTFDPNADGAVNAVAMQPDRKLLVGGSFTTIGGAARKYLARLNTNGSVDTAFAPAISGRVTGLAVQADGRILVLAEGSGVRSVLLRLMSDGSLDSSFTSVNGGSAVINSFALQIDGRIVVGGAFTSIAGATRSYLARLNADGSIDPTVTSAPNGPVTAVSVQRDGKILIGGRFSEVDGLLRFGLARITTPTSATGGDRFVTTNNTSTITWVRTGVGPEVASAYFESSKDLSTWTVLGEATRVANTNNWQLTGVSLATDHIYIRASAIAPTSPNSSSGLIEAQGQLTAVSQPVITSATVVGSPSGSSFYYAILTSGGSVTYSATGLPAGLTLNPSTGVISGTPTQAGTYTVVLGATNAAGTTSMTLTLIVGAPAGAKVEGSAVEAGANIRHANGKTYDQFLLTGTSANLRADPGEVLRLSFIDLDDDIVQVEFSGAGRFTVTLSGSSGPAAPALYNQAGVSYMKGHAAITVVDANETTNLSVFTVGTVTAVNQALFKSGVTYDGIADLASVSITSANGRFGGLRCANASFFGDTGLTGISAPNVQFAGPVFVGDISAYGTATSSLVIGSALDQTLVTGGDLAQANGAAVTVSGLTQLKFVAGTTSHGVALAAQANKAVLKQNGTDVTAQIVVNP